MVDDAVRERVMERKWPVLCHVRESAGWRSWIMKLVERKFKSSSAGDIIVIQTRNITPPLQPSFSPTLQVSDCSSFLD